VGTSSDFAERLGFRFRGTRHRHSAGFSGAIMFVERRRYRQYRCLLRDRRHTFSGARQEVAADECAPLFPAPGWRRRSSALRLGPEMIERQRAISLPLTHARISCRGVGNGGAESFANPPISWASCKLANTFGSP